MKIKRNPRGSDKNDWKEERKKKKKRGEERGSPARERGRRMSAVKRVTRISIICN